MSGWEIALLVALCAAFAVAVAAVIYNKVKGKGCCDCCDCAERDGKTDKSHCGGSWAQRSRTAAQGFWRGINTRPAGAEDGGRRIQ